MIAFRYRSDIDAVLFEVSGGFTLADYLRAMREFLQSEHFRPGMPSIWDFRQVDPAAVTSEDLRAIAAYQQEIAPTRGPTWKAALVVSSDVGYGMSRMFEAYAGAAPNEVMVFRGMEAAEAWVSSR